MPKLDICVIGAGTFGFSVIQQLNKLNKNVLVVDNDEKKLMLLDSQLNSLIVSEAADLRALEACGVGDFDIVIVGVSDNIEIIASLMELGIDTIIARAKTRRQARVLRQIGVDVIIQPEAESGIRTALLATNPNFIKFSSKLTEIGDGFVIGSAPITSDNFLNKTIKDLSLNKMGITIITVKKEKQETVLPSADLTFENGDIVTVVGKINKVTNFFNRVSKFEKNDKTIESNKQKQRRRKFTRRTEEF